MLVGILHSRIRAEERYLLDAFQRRGIPTELLDDREIVFDMHNPEPFRRFDVILERCINHSRAIHALELLNSWGIPTVNSIEAANVCGSKFSTTRALIEHGVACPRTFIAFTPESAPQAIETLGYPVVLKPAVGSWGRLLSKVKDRDAAESIHRVLTAKP